MTVWSSSVVIQPDAIATNAGEGAFRATSPNFFAPLINQGEFGTYFVQTTLIAAEPKIYFQGGVSLY